MVNTDEMLLSAHRNNLSIVDTGVAPKGAHRFYKFNDCGHVKEIACSNVRKGSNFRCTDCLNIEIAKRALLSGLILLDKKSDIGGKRWFKFTDCDHEVETYTGAYKLKCKECFNSKLIKEANDAGLEIIKSDVSGYKIYQLICGHKVKISTHRVQKNKIHCKECMDLLHEKEANIIGATIVNKAPEAKPSERTYRLNCGCIKNIRSDVVRIGYVKCEIHDDYFYNQPSNIYLIEFKSENLTWLKLGYSKNVNFRITQYGLDSNISKEILIVVPFESGKLAFEVERNLHNKYFEFKCDKKLMRNFHTESGFTECYSTEVKDQIINDLISYNNK